MHKDALDSSDKVLIVDDLVATGGTSVACAKLAEQSGAKVIGFAFILELAYLKPREEIAAEFGDEEVFSLISVD